MDNRKLRQCAVCLVFERELNDSGISQAHQCFADEIAVDFTAMEDERAVELANDCIAKREELDKIIENNLVDWTLSRISKTDLAILRLAFYEIVYLQQPFKVIINEAVELAKRYSPDKSPAFINGVLGGYVNK